MEDTNSRPNDSPENDKPVVDQASSRRANIHRVIWIIVSAGFLAYLMLGEIEARIWSFGRLYFQDRKVAHVWAYFGDRLPDMPASPLLPILYYLSLTSMVIGTVVGLWLLLADDAPPVAPAEISSGQEDISLSQSQLHE